MTDFANTLNLNGRWCADYNGVPWQPTPSAGGSGVNGALIVNGAGGVAPIPGTPVNGRVPAHFNGSTMSLTVTNQFSIVILAKATAAVAPGSIYYDEPCLCTDDGAGYIGISFSTSGLRAGLVSGQTPFIAQPTNQWFMTALRYDGDMMRFRVNSTDATPIEVGGIAVTPWQLRIGCNWDYSKFFTGDYFEIIRLARSLSDSELDSLKAQFNLTYGLSL